MTDMTSEDRSEGAPRVLLLYYTYTGQSLKVLEAAGEVFRERGCEVHKAEIEFTDQRYAERFSRFPMRRVWPDMLSVLPAQKRGATGEIRTPDDGAKRRLRPDLHRFADLVADSEHADALLPEVERGAKIAVRQAVRGVRRVPSVLARKPHGGARARREAGWSVRGRNPFRVSGRTRCARCCR